MYGIRVKVYIYQKTIENYYFTWKRLKKEEERLEGGEKIALNSEFDTSALLCGDDDTVVGV